MIPDKKWLWLIIPAVITGTGLYFYDAKLYYIVAFHVAAIPAIIFPLVYRGTPWKKTATGRALMNKSRSLAIVFFLSVLNYWWEFPADGYIFAVSMTYVAVALVYQFQVMYRLKKEGQRLERQKRRAPYDESNQEVAP
jgi:hypothetical protein